MKTITNNYNPKKQIGEYSSIDEIILKKLKKANQTLKNIDLSKISKSV